MWANDCMIVRLNERVQTIIMGGAYWASNARLGLVQVELVQYEEDGLFVTVYVNKRRKEKLRLSETSFFSTKPVYQ